MKELNELIEEVKRALRRSEVDESILKKANRLYAIVRENESQLRAEDELTFIKSTSLVAEILDYMGCVKESQWISTEGKRIFNQLPEELTPSTTLTERKLIKERIRFCLSYAQSLYRKHKYEEAKEIIIKCNVLCESLPDANQDFFCFGTLAHIHYVLGRIFRQTNEYNLAEEHFATSINYYYQRADQRKKTYENDKERVSEEINFVQQRVAILMVLGLAWINYTVGALKLARNNNILPARVLLSQSKDFIDTAYVNLMDGLIMRSLAGSDKKQLAPAIETIKKAYKVFKTFGQPRYIARAGYELSLAYTHMKDFDNADRYLQEVEKISQELNDVRWLCNAQIVRSRIEREHQHNYKQAAKFAAEALKSATLHKDTLCKIDAFIALGEANLEMEKYKEAREALIKALELNKKNPKIESVCNLLIAKTYALERNGKMAREHLANADALKQYVEHAYVHELRTKVEHAIDNLNRDFVIASPLSKMDYKFQFQLKRLKQFLLEQARNKEKDLPKVAELLGISRQTVYQWQRDLLPNHRSKKSRPKKAKKD